MAHVLIVEDEPDIATTYQKLIQRDVRHEVVIAHTGQEGLDIYKQLYATKPFDVIFLDYKLTGGMNGVDVAVEILKINAHQRIVFVTAYEVEAVKEVNNRLGVEGFDTAMLKKPIGMKELMDFINDDDLYDRLSKRGVVIDEVKKLAPTRQQLHSAVQTIENVIAKANSRVMNPFEARQDKNNGS